MSFYVQDLVWNTETLFYLLFGIWWLIYFSSNPIINYFEGNRMIRNIFIIILAIYGIILLVAIWLPNWADFWFAKTLGFPSRKENWWVTLSGLAFFGGVVAMFGIQMLVSHYNGVSYSYNYEILGIFYPILVTLYEIFSLTNFSSWVTIPLGIILAIATMYGVFMFWGDIIEGSYGQKRGVSRVIDVLPRGLQHIAFFGTGVIGLIGVLLFPIIGIFFMLVVWIGYIGSSVSDIV